MRSFIVGLGASLLVGSTACGAVSSLEEDASPETPDAAASTSDGGGARPPAFDASPPPPDAPVDACSPACTPGATRCDGAAIETCTLQSSGCTAWASAPCGAWQSCDVRDGGAVCACTDAPECASPGATCDSDGTHRICASGADGCLYLASTSTCALGCDAVVAGCFRVTAIGAGYSHACALAADGTMRCWGDDSFGQLGIGQLTGNALDPAPVRGLGGATKIAIGGFFSCALVANGSVECWGRNDVGQVGDGTKTDRSAPVSVVGLSGAVAISSGASHACALHADGTIACWGSNSHGQLGDGSVTDAASPVVVVGVQNAIAVSVGASHTCALLFGGDVMCWGGNAHGQLGDTSTIDSSLAGKVQFLGNATALSSGSAASHVCAVLSNGNVACWGDDSSAQIGDGGVGDGGTRDVLAPSVVQRIHDVTSVVAGSDLTCALGAVGTQCWGTGDSAAPVASVPSLVNGVSDAVAVAAGRSFACALRGSGDEIDCWGANANGELGNGSNASTSQPAPVR